jgi:hypothetical protein
VAQLGEKIAADVPDIIETMRSATPLGVFRARKDAFVDL